MTNKKIIIPLPHNDFDPTEVSIPWQIMKNAGFEIFFSTPDGQQAHADPMMISGEGLDPWGWIPLLKKLKLVGLLLRANKSARTAYGHLCQDKHFQNPLRYDQLNVSDFDGMLLPGGHAPKMRPYLEDSVLQTFIVDFFEQTNELNLHKPVAAVCHGVLLAARSISNKTGQSVLFGKKTTALTWEFEKSAWNFTRFFARFWDSNYYRTYQEGPKDPAGYWSVEHEIKRLLESEGDFIDVPRSEANFKLKTSAVNRDSLDNDKPAWVVEDRNYLSARWPGDAHTLANRFVALLNGHS